MSDRRAQCMDPQMHGSSTEVEFSVSNREIKAEFTHCSSLRLYSDSYTVCR